MSVVFTARMESDFSEWTSETDSGGNINWSADAGLGGSSGGMAISPPGNTTSMYLAKTYSSITTGLIRGRFYLDPNSLSMANTSNHVVFAVYNATPATLVYSLLSYETANGFRTKFYHRTDAGLSAGTVFDITDAPHYFEFYITKSDGSNNGTFTTWCDGVQKDAVTDIDNDTAFNGSTLLRAGANSDLDATTTGTYYIDEIILRSDGSEIGPGLWDVSLTAVENTQSQTCDAAVVSFTPAGDPTVNLTAAENAQAQASDAATLTATHTVTAHGVSIESIIDAAAVSFNAPPVDLTAGENTQAQSSDAAVVSFGIGYNVTAAENTQSQASDPAVLRAGYPVAAVDNTQTQTSDAASLKAYYPLAGAENTQTQTSDAASLSYTAPGAGITPADNTQAQTMDAPVLVAFYPITAGENTQAQLSDTGIVVIMALLLHGNRKLYPAGTRVTHYAPARVTLEVDDD